MTQGRVVQSNPEILGGEPVFAGTRVPVRNLIDYLSTEAVSMSSWRTFPQWPATRPSPCWKWHGRPRAVRLLLDEPMPPEICAA